MTVSPCRARGSDVQPALDARLHRAVSQLEFEFRKWNTG
jgi:hypothetical protein